MSDSDTHFDPKDAAQASPPSQVIPPPAYSQPRIPPRSDGSPTTVRRSLFRR
jgi:hypothetical protein